MSHSLDAHRINKQHAENDFKSNFNLILSISILKTEFEGDIKIINNKSKRENNFKWIENMYVYLPGIFPLRNKHHRPYI